MPEFAPSLPASSQQRWLLVVIAICLTLVACGDGDEKPAETPGLQHAAVISLEPPTTLAIGTPAPPRTAKCPDKKLPDQCGTWGGVELHASRTEDPKHCGGVEDEHCLCDVIDFVIPAELRVTSGKSGWDSDKAELTYRTAAGREVQCRYHGNGKPPGKSPAVAGNQYVFEKCNDGSKPGQAKRSDWFELDLEHGGSGKGATEVELRLGEPDVVGGVVQEQIFYANDARIPGAALHVPRGTTPGFETFSLSVLPQVPLKTTIPNANDPVTTISYAVDVHAASTDHFTFTQAPGLPCARIELPYDPATLSAVAGPGGESTIQAQQLTTLTGITSGANVVSPGGAVTVDLTRHTFSFCVEHLSYWVGTSGSLNASMTTATISGLGLYGVDLRSGLALPSLVPHQTYQLTLGFTNVGGTAWLPANTSLVAVNAALYPAPPSTAPPSVSQAPVSPTTSLTSWGTPVTQTWGNQTISRNAQAVFTFGVTCPDPPGVLNFCLRNGTSLATGYFGDCFSWDPGTPGGPAVPGAGTKPVPSPEACDGIDNDGDGLIDEDALPCYSGAVNTEGKGTCHAGARTCSAGTWGACVGEVVPAIETCNNLDDNCDGTIDEGVLNACGGCAVLAGLPGAACSNDQLGECARGGTFQCTGVDATACNAPVVASSAELCNGLDDDCDGTPDNGVLNACSGCGALAVAVGVACGNNQLGQCSRVGTFQCSGPNTTACNAAAVTPGAEVCNGLDDDCDGTADNGVLNACGTCGGVPSEVCDGFDNNCDGRVDEGCPPPAPSCGAGECGGACGDCPGTQVCAGGHCSLPQLCNPTCCDACTVCDGKTPNPGPCGVCASCTVGCVCL